MNKSDQLQRVFDAGRVLRWHAESTLSRTGDYLDGHSARVARIIMALWPDADVSLLKAALTHDDGEHVTGDIPYLMKRKYGCGPFMEIIETTERAAIRELWGGDMGVDNRHAEKKLKFADRLDAYMWVRHHCPEKLLIEGWPEAIKDIEEEAKSFGFKVL